MHRCNLLVQNHNILLQTEPALTGVFASDVPIICHQQGIPPITVCSRCVVYLLLVCGIPNFSDISSDVLGIVLDLHLLLTLKFQSKDLSLLYMLEVYLKLVDQYFNYCL